MSMKIVTVFGRLLLTSGSFIRNNLLTLTDKVMRQVQLEETTPVKIWGVLDGPYSRDDLPWADSLPEDYHTMLEVKIEIDGEISDKSLWYSSFDEAYEVVNYFYNNVEPLEL